MEFADFSIELLTLLFFVAMFAGVVDTLAGGGGLIVMPALIMSGLPALAVLGTNKLQGCMGTATSSFMMLRKGRITVKEVKVMMLYAFMGAFAGAVAVQYVNTDALEILIPIVLAVIALYFLFAPIPSEHLGKVKLSDKKFTAFVVPTIGAYDGMFGPGTGSFFAAAGVSLKGLGIVQATAVAKPLNFATNAAAITVFVFVGQVIWPVALVMMLGQLCGAWIGSHCLLRISPAKLRLLVVLICFSLLAKYVYTSWGFH